MSSDKGCAGRPAQEASRGRGGGRWAERARGGERGRGGRVARAGSAAGAGPPTGPGRCAGPVGSGACRRARPGAPGAAGRAPGTDRRDRGGRAPPRPDPGAGSHRRARKATCRARSVGSLCRLPRARQQRSEGAGAVRNGRARARPARGTGAGSVRLGQRGPPASTKCPFGERTGSRQMPFAAVRLPRRRSIVPSMPSTAGPAGAKAAIRRPGSRRAAARAARASTRCSSVNRLPAEPRDP